MSDYTDLERETARLLYFEENFYQKFLSGGPPLALFREFQDKRAYDAASVAIRTTNSAPAIGRETYWRHALSYADTSRTTGDKASRTPLTDRFFVGVPWADIDYDNGYAIRRQNASVITRPAEDDFTWLLRLDERMVPAAEQDDMRLTLHEEYRETVGGGFTTTPSERQLASGALPERFRVTVNTLQGDLLVLDLSDKDAAGRSRSTALRERATAVAIVTRFFCYLSVARVVVAFNAALTVTDTGQKAGVLASGFHRILVASLGVPFAYNPVDDVRYLIAATPGGPSDRLVRAQLAGVVDRLALDAAAKKNILTIAERLETNNFRTRASLATEITDVNNYRVRMLRNRGLTTDPASFSASMGAFVEMKRATLESYRSSDPIRKISPTELVAFNSLVVLAADIATTPLTIVPVPEEFEEIYRTVRTQIDEFAPLVSSQYNLGVSEEIKPCATKDSGARAIFDTLRRSRPTSGVFYAGSVLALLSQVGRPILDLVADEDDVSVVEQALESTRRCVDEINTAGTATPLWDQLPVWAKLFDRSLASRETARGAKALDSFVERSRELAPATSRVISGGLLATRSEAQFLDKQTREMVFEATRQTFSSRRALAGGAVPDKDRYIGALDEVARDLEKVAELLFGRKISEADATTPTSRNDTLTDRAVAKQTAGLIGALYLKLNLGDYSPEAEKAEDGISPIESRERYGNVLVYVRYAKVFSSELERFYASNGRGFEVDTSIIPDISPKQAADDAVFETTINRGRNAEVQQRVADMLDRVVKLQRDVPVDKDLLTSTRMIKQATNIKSHLDRAAVSRDEESYADVLRIELAKFRRDLQGQAVSMSSRTRPANSSSFLRNLSVSYIVLAGAALVAREENTLASIANRSEQSRVEPLDAIKNTERLIGEAVTGTVRSILKPVGESDDTLFQEYTRLVNEYLTTLSSRKPPLVRAALLEQFGRVGSGVVYTWVDELFTSVKHYFLLYAPPPGVIEESTLLRAQGIEKTDILAAQAMFRAILGANEISDAVNNNDLQITPLFRPTLKRIVDSYVKMLNATDGSAFSAYLISFIRSVDLFFDRIESISNRTPISTDNNQRILLQKLVQLEDEAVLQARILAGITITIRSREIKFDIKQNASDLLDELLGASLRASMPISAPAVLIGIQGLPDLVDLDEKYTYAAFLENVARALNSVKTGPGGRLELAAGFEVEGLDFFNNSRDKIDFSDDPDAASAERRDFLAFGSLFAVAVEIRRAFNALVDAGRRTRALGGAISPEARDRYITELREAAEKAASLGSRLAVAWEERIERIRSTHRVFTELYETWRGLAAKMSSATSNQLKALGVETAPTGDISKQKKENEKLKQLVSVGTMLRGQLTDSLNSLSRDANLATAKGKKIEQLEADLEKIADSVRTIGMRTGIVSGEVSTILGAFDKFKEDFEPARASWELKKKELTKFSKDFASVEAAINDASGAIPRLKERISTVDLLVKAKDGSLKSLVEQADGLKKSTALVTDTIAELKKLETDVKKVIDTSTSLDSKSNQLIGKIETSLEAAGTTLAASGNRVGELLDIQRQSFDVITAQRAEVGRLKVDNTALRDDIKRVTGEARQIATQGKEFQKLIDGVGTQYEALKKLVEKKTILRENTERDLQELSDRWSELGAEDKYVSLRDRMLKTADDMTERLRVAKAARRETTSTLASIKTVQTDMERDSAAAARLKVDVDRLARQVETTQQTVNVTLDNQPTATRGRMIGLVAKFESMIVQLETVLNRTGALPRGGGGGGMAVDEGGSSSGASSGTRDDGRSKRRAGVDESTQTITSLASGIREQFASITTLVSSLQGVESGQTGIRVLAEMKAKAASFETDLQLIESKYGAEIPNDLDLTGAPSTRQRLNAVVSKLAEWRAIIADATLDEGAVEKVKERLEVARSGIASAGNKIDEGVKAALRDKNAIVARTKTAINTINGYAREARESKRLVDEKKEIAEIREIETWLADTLDSVREDKAAIAASLEAIGVETETVAVIREGQSNSEISSAQVARSLDLLEKRLTEVLEGVVARKRLKFVDAPGKRRKPGSEPVQEPGEVPGPVQEPGEVPDTVPEAVEEDTTLATKRKKDESPALPPSKQPSKKPVPGEVPDTVPEEVEEDTTLATKRKKDESPKLPPPSKQPSKKQLRERPKRERSDKPATPPSDGTSSSDEVAKQPEKTRKNISREDIIERISRSDSRLIDLARLAKANRGPLERTADLAAEAKDALESAINQGSSQAVISEAQIALEKADRLVKLGQAVSRAIELAKQKTSQLISAYNNALVALDTDDAGDFVERIRLVGKETRAAEAALTAATKEFNSAANPSSSPDISRQLPLFVGAPGRVTHI